MIAILFIIFLVLIILKYIRIRKIGMKQFCVVPKCTVVYILCILYIYSICIDIYDISGLC